MAQDVIVTKQSERIDAKILKVTDSEIEYKRQNNLDGPTFTLSTSKIATIIFSNGDVQAYNVNEEPKSNARSTRYKSGLSLGFSMPNIRSEWNYYTYRFPDQGSYSHVSGSSIVKAYGFYLGYESRIIMNKYISFRPGVLINWAWDTGHMLDLRVPILTETGITFDNDMGLFLCFGPQALFGLSLGSKAFDYPEGINHLDFGLSFGGSIYFSKSVSLEVLYTFGLTDRNSSEDFKEKIDFFTAGFNFYL